MHVLEEARPVHVGEGIRDEQRCSRSTRTPRSGLTSYATNLSGDSREATVHRGDQAGRLLSNLLTHEHSEADARGPHHLILEPYGYRWYRIGGLGYLLDRSI
ncbi:MAG: hypothetical protein ABJE66_17375 [Deltaproteobacteria bacterium]